MITFPSTDAGDPVARVLVPPGRRCLVLPLHQQADRQGRPTAALEARSPADGGPQPDGAVQSQQQNPMGGQMFIDDI